MKLYYQLLTIIVLFFGLWYGLSQVDWLSVFKVSKISYAVEQKLGTLYWDFFKQTGKEVSHSAEVVRARQLLQTICDKNGIAAVDMKLHVLDDPEVNAFALPGKRLVIFTGLIQACHSNGALAGVIAHELAHIEKKHVMKKLIKEIGLGILISTVGGNAGGEVVQKAAQKLSSSAYDRRLEKEADMQAVDYLIQADMDPRELADFFNRLADAEPSDQRVSALKWVRTHPELKERAAYIVEYARRSKQ